MTGANSEHRFPRWCSRVVVVTTRFPEMSGGAKFVENFSMALQTAGIAVEVVSLWPGRGDPPVPTYTVIERETLHRNPVLRGARSATSRLLGVGRLLYKKLDWRRLRRAYARRMRSLDSSTLVVLSDVGPASFLADCGFTWSQDGPLVVAQHHSAFDALGGHQGLRERIVKTFSSVDGFVALTPDDAQKFGELLGVPSVAIANPVRDDETADIACIARRGRHAEAVVLARLSPEKQLDLLVRAFTAATGSERLRHWRLKIYGDGPERERLSSLIDESGEGGRVELCGRTDDVQEALSRASINLLSSKYEGTPMSFVEAAQQGVASLSFDSSPGVRAMIAELGGYLVQSTDDEGAYAEALRSALAAPEELSRRGMIARRSISRYESGNVLAAWADFVSELHERRTREAKAS